MQFKNSKYKNLVFLCGARDFHAMDWYRRSLEQLSNINIYILTDLIEGEKYKKLINARDKVFRLIILDNFLLRDQSGFGHFWRRLIKIIVFPLQVLLIKRFAKINPDSIFYAHAMYYIWLAKFAGVKFVGRPQGNDILTNPFKSRVYISVFNILKLKPKIRRIMWSRRAQEYDTKIFSGDPIKIGEVVRDLFRKNSQPEQSYSERQMFQIAIERLARELAAVEKTDYFQSTEKIESILRNK